jgi:hypothetical protein
MFCLLTFFFFQETRPTKRPVGKLAPHLKQSFLMKPRALVPTSQSPERLTKPDFKAKPQQNENTPQKIPLTKAVTTVPNDSPRIPVTKMMTQPTNEIQIIMPKPAAKRITPMHTELKDPTSQLQTEDPSPRAGRPRSNSLERNELNKPKHFSNRTIDVNPTRSQDHTETADQSPDTPKPLRKQQSALISSSNQGDNPNVPKPAFPIMPPASLEEIKRGLAQDQKRILTGEPQKPVKYV